MSDQLRWWKLWTSALNDPDLANLSLGDCWRWATLGMLLRVHGDGGTATWPRPGHALATAWRTTWPRLPHIARQLPGVTVTVTDDSITLTMRNWHKYQEDSSVYRTRTWRERQRQRDGQPPVTGDGQRASPVTVQTRRDETRREKKERSRDGGYVDNSAPRPPTDPPPTGLLPQSPGPSTGADALPLADLVAAASAKATTQAAQRVAALRAAEGKPTPPPPQEDVQPAW